MYDYECPKLIDLNRTNDIRGSMTVMYEGSGHSAIVLKTTTSNFGTLRGFHWQRVPKLQSKLITVTKGEIFDVCIEVDNGQLTSNIFVNRLSAAQQLYVPPNFAHAYLSLVDDTQVTYLCDGAYGNEVSYNPREAFSDWPIDLADLKISNKDLNNGI
ncbi:dTDP-4-dehydrorhamnose 3,5-epimerase [Planktomarina temperata]|nr:dTDP-4-dehydrorhamnose 3,5-epimerase [Planktomarina temperata]